MLEPGTYILSAGLIVLLPRDASGATLFSPRPLITILKRLNYCFCLLAVASRPS